MSANIVIECMPFTIVTDTGQEFTWGNNDKKPEFQFHDPKKPFIAIFKAEGHELKRISNLFPNIPISHGKCVWRGEMAQFIYDNL